MKALSIGVVAIAAIAISAGAQAQSGGLLGNSGKSGGGGYASPPAYGTGSNSNSNHVDGYTRQNGTVVQPYERTNPNSTPNDNYGTRGNYNPNKPPRY